MSDESLTNAAVEFMRASYLFGNVMVQDEVAPALADDFVFDDLRSGFNYGLLNASAYSELVRSAWDVGSERPKFSILEVIAVRGQSIAAMAVAIDYGSEMRTEMIACVRLDPQLQRLQRRVQFDVDARDAAIAELDRMHADLDA